MKPAPHVVVAVGIGYLLGRTRKMRLALMIAAASATGKFGGTRQLLQQGVKRLAASPELGKITDSVRGELLESAKSAAIAAASGRIESLNSRIQDQISMPHKSRRGEDTDEPEPDDEEFDEVDEYEDEDEGADEDEQPEEEPTPSRRVSSQPSGTRQARGASGKSPVQRARR